MVQPAQSLWYLPETGECPVADTLKLIGGKHTPKVLHCLAFADHNFLELLRALPQISRKVLTEELRSLEEGGLVLRTELGDARKRVRYALTPKGRQLAGILNQMFDWAIAHREEERLPQLA